MLGPNKAGGVGRIIPVVFIWSIFVVDGVTVDEIAVNKIEVVVVGELTEVVKIDETDATSPTYATLSAYALSG